MVAPRPNELKRQRSHLYRSESTRIRQAVDHEADPGEIDVQIGGVGVNTARIYGPHYLPMPSMGLVIFPISKHKNQANEDKYNHTWMLWIVENDPICIGYSSHMLILNKSKYALVESSLAIGIINASNSPFPSMNLNSIIPSHQ